MKHRSISEITKLAWVGRNERKDAGSARCERLERLALLLDRQRGTARLLSGIEHYDGVLQMSLRAFGSPPAIAYQEPLFRAEGLKSDRFGDTMDFFGLTRREAHILFYEFHYSENPSFGVVAERVRSIARKTRVRDVWNRLIQRLERA